jgi:phage shock protein E
MSNEVEEPNRFQKLVLAAKEKIKEISPHDAARELDDGSATLIDVRSDADWKQGHARDAKHLERGEIELEIEEQFPDLDQRIICYCGGGSRSALVAESLQKMGYHNVRSVKGGFRAWKAAGLPTAQ